MSLFDFLRSVEDPIMLLFMLILGMLGWTILYLLALFFCAVQKGILLQNIALRREIAILRKSLGRGSAKQK